MAQELVQWTAEMDAQVVEMRKQIAPDATDIEFAYFRSVCKHTGLNPIVRQIYAIHRKTWNKDTNQSEKKMTIQTSIDGFRLIAERTGKYAGQTLPHFTYTGEGHVEACSIAVKKLVGGMIIETPAIAYYDDFVQSFYDKKTGINKPMGLWEEKPRVMLEKCAEARALRKAFPQELSGLYTEDEITESIVVAPPENPNPPTSEQIAELQALIPLTERTEQFWLNKDGVQSLGHYTSVRIQYRIDAIKKWADENGKNQPPAPPNTATEEDGDIDIADTTIVS